MRRIVRRYVLIVIVGLENEFGILIVLNGVILQSVNVWKLRINNVSVVFICLFVFRGGKINVQSMYEEEYLLNWLFIVIIIDFCCYLFFLFCYLFVMKGSNEI